LRHAIQRVEKYAYIFDGSGGLTNIQNEVKLFANEAQTFLLGGKPDG
jgi:hypothetical protein